MLNKEIFLKGMKTISTIWENFKMSAEKAEIFYSFFRKYPASIFLQMIQLYIEKEEWPPQSPRSLMKYYEELLRKHHLSQQMTADEAWAEVREGLKRYSLHWEHHERDKFYDFLKRYPPIVGTITQQFESELAGMKSDDGFIGNAFKKAYQAALEKVVSERIRENLLQITSKNVDVAHVELAEKPPEVSRLQ
jgi:hypothetical protein